jgi:hypothetical protein
MDGQILPAENVQRLQRSEPLPAVQLIQHKDHTTAFVLSVKRLLRDFELLVKIHYRRAQFQLLQRKGDLLNCAIAFLIPSPNHFSDFDTFLFFEWTSSCENRSFSDAETAFTVDRQLLYKPHFLSEMF